MPVFLVGAGPGDPGLLTLRAKQLIESADVLVYDYLAAEPILAFAPASCERIYVGKRAKAHTMSQDEINALLVRLAREGKRVVRLKGGDPFVFGRGGEEAQVLRSEGIDFEVVPGITAGIAAPAYAGIPVTHRAHNTAVTFITGHEDPTKDLSTLDWSKLADPHQTLIFYMAMSNLREISAALVRNGLAATTPVAIIHEGTKPAQQTLVTTLENAAGDAQRAGIGPPAIVVVGDVVDLREELRWFDRRPLFGKRVLITRQAPSSEEFAERLREAGAEPVLAPLIRIAPPEDPQAVARAVKAAKDFDYIVFSSRNGVERFWEELEAAHLDARALFGVRIAAIGPRTADALRAKGIAADFVPSQYVSESVAEGLLERTVPDDRVLLFRAQEARDVLPDALREAGRNVTVVAAYRAVRAEVPNLGSLVERCDILTFTSAGIVRSFVAQLEDAPAATRGKIIACIGPITAQAVRDAGLEPTIVAEEFTTEGMARSLVAVR